MSDKCGRMSDMNTINVRQLLRGFRSYFPLPDEGICIRGREVGQFYIYPTPKRISQDEPTIENTLPIPLKKAIEKTEKKLEEFKKENFERPLVCPKHGGQLIGGKYACCE